MLRCLCNSLEAAEERNLYLNSFVGSGDIRVIKYVPLQNYMPFSDQDLTLNARNNVCSPTDPWFLVRSSMQTDQSSPFEAFNFVYTFSILGMLTFNALFSCEILD